VRKDFSGRLADAATEGATDADLATARAGDSAAFGRLVKPLRRELHAHCYRMLGSVHDADDALQDAQLRAWRGLARFEGRSSLRSWLYTVATHSCLDIIEHRGKRALPMDLGPSSDRAVLDQSPLAEVAWLGPSPDAGIADSPAGPCARYEQREAIELAFAGRGFLPWQRRLQPAPRLVDHSADPARRGHQRNHVVPRPGPLRALRAARLTVGQVVEK
jgi:RNA polymerase sigma-70 factor, ECF subfamily